MVIRDASSLEHVGRDVDVAGGADVVRGWIAIADEIRIDAIARRNRQALAERARRHGLIVFLVPVIRHCLQRLKPLDNKQKSKSRGIFPWSPAGATRAMPRGREQFGKLLALRQ